MTRSGWDELLLFSWSDLAEMRCLWITNCWILPVDLSVDFFRCFAAKTVDFVCGFIRWFATRTVYLYLYIFSPLRGENCIFYLYIFFAASRRNLYIFTCIFFLRKKYGKIVEPPNFNRRTKWMTEITQIHDFGQKITDFSQILTVNTRKICVFQKTWFFFILDAQMTCWPYSFEK